MWIWIFLSGALYNSSMSTHLSKDISWFKSDLRYDITNLSIFSLHGWYYGQISPFCTILYIIYTGGFGPWSGGQKYSFINKIYVNPKWQSPGQKLLRRLQRPLQISRDKKSERKIVIILWHTLRWKDIIKSRYSSPRWPSVLRHNAII